MIVVSVKTETNVPINTALDACSTHVSYYFAKTNTLRAGGSATINIAVLIQFCSNGKKSLTATIGGISHGIFLVCRSATVTPSVNWAQGAAAF